MPSIELKNSCKNLNKHYICTRKHPSMTINENSPCEILAYTKQENSHAECPKRVINLKNTLLITMEQQNKWIYIAPTENRLVITCDKITYKEKLIEAGTLVLAGNCAATATDFRIETAGKISKEITEIFVPMFNISLAENDNKIINELKNDNLGEKTKLRNIISNPQELNNLGHRLRDIKRELESNRTDNMHHHHNIGVYTLATISALALSSYIAFKYIKNKRSQLRIKQTDEERIYALPDLPKENKPTPKERSTNMIEVELKNNTPNTGTM